MDRENNLIWVASLGSEYSYQSYSNHGPMYRAIELNVGSDPSPAESKSDDRLVLPDTKAAGLVPNTAEYALAQLDPPPTTPLQVALFLTAHMDRVLRHR
jgi:hypothetical protein